MSLYDQFIQWAGSLNAQQVADWLKNLEWNRVVPEITGKFIGFLLGFFASWLLLFRRQLKALDRLKRGDSDDVLFQAHFLAPVPGSDKCALIFRNLMPSTTVNELYDNPAARKIVREMADYTSLKSPVLRTEGLLGFEVLNDAFNHIAGHLATTPFPRETWLFAMTCEDRKVVRRKCVRCFLIRPAELERFANWRWCRENVMCEQPWHWYRIVALHQFATQWKQEEAEAQNPSPKAQGMPLVDKHATHRRIRPLSAGIFVNEKPVGEPVSIQWTAQEWELKKMGLDLSASASSAS
ncbi:hypothetical protein [Prosthecobacter sp.]|uniref:hypothetical protein n=1 Tax=Prosthecobacter sp. TaxID=1965333 RepID=UPI002AB9CFC8|nr:hypothetical protein [Prosthecobacter sp.]MDZ4404652.1 hypothetical protein [Prosthecobacter sp.]